MGDQHLADWGSPFTLDIAHSEGCPCCDGTGSIEYGLAIRPSHLKKTQGAAIAVLRIYQEELDSLVILVAATLLKLPSVSQEHDKDAVDLEEEEETIRFELTRNKKGQNVGQYSLNIVGRGVDDLLPVNKPELQSLLNQVVWMQLHHQAAMNALEKRTHRERTIKSRMKGKTIDEIKAELQRVNPCVGNDDLDSKIVKVLFAASFRVGPYIRRLVSFTGYSRGFITDISRRMRDSGLWVGGKTFVQHWFDEDLHWTPLGFAQDCEVAEGRQIARPDGDGEWLYEPSGRYLSQFGKEQPAHAA